MLKVFVYELMLPAVHRKIYEQVLENRGGGYCSSCYCAEGLKRRGGVPKEESSSAIGIVSGVYSILRSYR